MFAEPIGKTSNIAKSGALNFLRIKSVSTSLQHILLLYYS